MATDNDCVQYWAQMKDRAAMHISAVTEKPDPESESELKDHVSMALKRGSSHEAAEVLVEAIEWMLSCMMLRKHDHMQALDHASK